MSLRGRFAGLLVLLLILAAGCGGERAPVDVPGSGPAIQQVVLISLDTTRADHLGAYGQQPSVTPHLDALAAGGIVFDQCTAPTPLTLPSHSTMMTGTDPYVHGVRNNSSYHLHDSHETLAERLREAGWQTAAEIGAFVLNAEFGIGQGFEHYGDLPTGESQRRGDEVVDAAIDWLEQRRDPARPFFLFVHLFDAHTPYDAPAPFDREVDDPYLAEIAWADQQVGRLLDALQRLDPERETLIVVTGDHGESRGQHGEDTHSLFVYDATVAVPLIVHATGRIPAGRRVAGQVRLVDVAPTVVDLAGLPAMSAAQGLSLVPLIDDPQRDEARAAYAETFYPHLSFGYAPLRALRRDGWKYIHAPRPELYDLRQDPAETTNLAAEQPQRAAQLRQALGRLLEQAPADGVASSTQAPADPETLERLRSLGYLGGRAGAESTAVGESLELDGDDPKDHVAEMAALARALGWAEAGDDAAAERALADLLRRVSDDRSGYAAAHELYGRLLLRRGAHGEAIEQYRRALAGQPGHPTWRANLASALAEAGRTEEALGEFERAWATPPRLAETRISHGLLLDRLGRREEAIVAYREALEVDPGLLRGQRLLGESLVKAGRAEEGLAVLERARASHPDDLDLLRETGQALIALRRAGEALPRFERLVVEQPGEARNHRGLGLARLQLGQAPAAAESLREAVRLDDGNSRAWYSLAAAEARAGNADAALAAAERALELARRSGESAFAERIAASIEQFRSAAAGP